MRVIVFFFLIFLVGCQPTEFPTSSSHSSSADQSFIDPTLLTGALISIGNPDAEQTLFLVTEHHCPYCREFHQKYFPLLQSDFIDSGRLKLDIAILPLQKYEYSGFAVQTLFCAVQQGKGPEMHDILMQPYAKDRATVVSQAVGLGMDGAIFHTCLDSEESLKAVENQKLLAERLDVELVPSFFLDAKRKTGLLYYADLKGWIESKLSSK